MLQWKLRWKIILLFKIPLSGKVVNLINLSEQIVSNSISFQKNRPTFQRFQGLALVDKILNSYFKNLTYNKQVIFDYRQFFLIKYKIS